MSPDALLRGTIVPATPFEGIVMDPLWDDPTSIVAILRGERCQGERLFWGEPHFSDEALKKLEERIMASTSLGAISSEQRVAPASEDRAAVKDFENNIYQRLGSSVNLIGSNCRRYYDRAVLFISGVNGEALSHALAKSGFETFTSAACAWNSPHLNQWLPKLGLTPESVESALIIPLKTLNQETFEEILVSTIKEFQKLSDTARG